MFHAEKEGIEGVTKPIFAGIFAIQQFLEPKRRFHSVDETPVGSTEIRFLDETLGGIEEPVRVDDMIAEIVPNSVMRSFLQRAFRRISREFRHLLETAIADDDENRGEFRRQSEINVPKSVTSQRCEIGPIFGLGGPETAFFPLGFRLRPQKLRQCLHLAQKRRKGWMGLEAFPTGEEFHRASLSAERVAEREIAGMDGELEGMEEVLLVGRERVVHSRIVLCSLARGGEQGNDGK